LTVVAGCGIIQTMRNGADKRAAASKGVTMSIYGVTVDESKGFDAMRGAKVIAHYASYKEARAYADAHKGVYIRYWEKKEE